MPRRRLVGWLVALAALSAAAPADAYVIESFGTASATNGIVLGPDGNFWVSETFNDSVARVSPAGVVIGRLSVGSLPQSMATGPGGRVWVAVTGEDKLVWIDATSSNPSAHDVFTDVGAGGSDCGPVGIVDGGNGSMYFSMPDDDDPDNPCVGPSMVGRLDANEDITTTDAAGTAFDLEVSGGRLWVPGAFDDVVFKLFLGDLSEDDQFDVAGSPDGIAADSSGNVWVALYDGGGVARISSSSVTTFFSPQLLHPFGIVAGADGFIYVLGSDSNNIQRVSASGQFTNFPVGGTHQPWQVVNGPDGDIWFTDFLSANLLRFVSSAPRASTSGATALSSTSGSFTASVNPRGNETQVVFDYGPTTAYGNTTAPVTLPAGTAAVPVTTAAQGLPPSTTLHVRVRASNGEGAVAGGDVTFTTPVGDADGDGVTPPADCNDADPKIKPGAKDIPGDKIDQNCNGKDAAFPRLAANTTMTWSTFDTYVVLKTIRVEQLRKGQTVTTRCKGRGCPFKKRSVKIKKKGTRNFGKPFKGRKLRVGTKVTVSVTQPKTIGRITILTVRRKKDPKFVKRCLRPGSTKPISCG